MTRPMFTLEGTDASPKLVALFQDVRKRTLPEAVKQTYQRARSSYDAGNIADASRQFKEVVALADTAPPEYAELMKELKMLAAGFVRLTEASTPAPKVEAPVTAALPPPTATQMATTSQTGATTAKPANSGSTAARPANSPVRSSPPPVAPPAAAPSVIYDAASTAVKPPVAVQRSIPGWTRPMSLRAFSFQGALTVLIDEKGAVTDAVMTKPIHAAYDPALVAAAKRWHFQPATVDGRPVKYRVTYPINVEPQ
ncbi:MAG: energy transducer TonB [Acidobacteria bacterium]|nr:energy transducer TonB [Acidobacteriota bacterium]